MRQSLSLAVFVASCTGVVGEAGLDLAVTPAGDAATAMEVDARSDAHSTGAASDDDGAAARFELDLSAGPASFLTDAVGRPLYMFVGDVPGAGDSECLGSCRETWAPFDVSLDAGFAPGIEPGDVARLHRRDGAWQAQYKGRPLYYRMDDLEGELSVDGVDGRWFLARDYQLFLTSADADLAMAVPPESRPAFLTDGRGRTLYICLDDVPATGSARAISACRDDCLANRPPFAPREVLGDLRLPSRLNPADLAPLSRDDGLTQLTFRGWPLYYYRGDSAAGDTDGHNQGAWRAIDPTVLPAGNLK